MLRIGTSRFTSLFQDNNMLHSPSGFPSRISRRIIGCDFSSLDTFTHCLLKAVFHKYHAAKIYNALATSGRTQLPGTVSHVSLNKAFNWAKFWIIIMLEISLERIVESREQ